MLRLTKTLGLPLALLLITLFFLHLGLEKRLQQDDLASAASEQEQEQQQQPRQQEKFLTYLPHSGLHNQRIALINGIVLAKALNRTLIMPELNLGTATYWRPTSLLPYRLDECGDESVHVAPAVKDRKLKDGRRKAWWSSNCFDYRNYLPMAVDWVFDLTAVHEMGVKTLQRQDMRLDYFERVWSVPRDERNQSLVYQVMDNSRYSYQIVDDGSSTDYEISTSTKFNETHSLQQLGKHQEPFMIFNSLFGSDRLALPSGGVWARTRESLRQEMGVSHPWVVNASQSAMGRLGGAGAYIGVHIRMGDGVFKVMQDDTMAQVRQQLIQRQHDDTTLNETTLTHIQSLDSKDRLSACLEVQSSHHHHRLGLIYMTTDAPSPHTTLPHLFEEFVCLFALGDFKDIVDSTLQLQPPLLDHRHHQDASVPTTQGEILLPLIDGEIASQASFFVPTPGSTFSGYIEHRNKRFQRIRV